jgi:hypothetical protein
VQSLSGDLRYQWSPKLTLGVDGSYARVDPHDATQNDSQLWHVGIFGEWLLPHDHQLRLAAGYQASQFESRPLLFSLAGFFPPVFVFYTNGDSNSPSGPFCNLRFAGRLTDRISHEFSAGYESAPAEISNATSACFANYSVSIQPWEAGHLVVSGYYESAEASGGVFDSQQDQYGGDVYLEQQICSRWSVGAGYHYGCLDGAPAGLASTPLTASQQAVRMGTSYEIAKGWAARLEWQSSFLDDRTNLYGEIDQNRIILSVRAEF